MTVAAGGWPLAARPPAVLVASDQRAAPRTPDRPLGAADVDRHRVLHEDPGDAAVAGPPLHRLGGDRKGELGLGARRTEKAKQRFDRTGDLHLDGDLAAGRCELDQGVRQPLRPFAVIKLSHRLGQGLERGPQSGTADGVENALRIKQPSSAVLMERARFSARSACSEATSCGRTECR